MTTPTTRSRFEFGRHETFAVRESWLGKGLERLERTGTFDPDLETADALGLGSRMAKSLRFWLEAAGLVEREGGRPRGVATGTPLAATLRRHDPFLEYPATWWFVHLAVARRTGTVWTWFFNEFVERAFERESCIEAFVRHVRDRASNTTTRAVMQRDVNCLLGAYAAPSGGERPDPEDGTISPLRGLGLLVRHVDTGRYERTRPLDRVPVEAFLAAATLQGSDDGRDAIPLADLAGGRNGAGRLFGMDGEAIDAAASAAEGLYWREGVAVSLLGAARTLTLPRVSVERWLDLHFRRIGQGR